MEYSNRKKKTKRGRKLIGIETMRSSMHIDFNEQQVLDAATLPKFRHMLKVNNLGEKNFADVNNRLYKADFIIHNSTIVDAGSGYIHTIIGYL